jgi:hypothetical protein
MIIRLPSGSSRIHYKSNKQQTQWSKTTQSQILFFLIYLFIYLFIYLKIINIIFHLCFFFFQCTKVLIFSNTTVTELN